MIIDRLQLLQSLAVSSSSRLPATIYRSSATEFDRGATIIDRPPQNSIVVLLRSSPQLINNDNRDRLESQPQADSPTFTLFLIIIIIH